ncbi:MAG: YbhB/YbcL family Raf kinase inhibitor-like protein [Anaerotardibacter sp.]
MNISIPVENGYLPDVYGKYSPEECRLHGDNIFSFPVSISEVPKNTQSLAIVFIDYDSTPVCGFTWIHWLACNIDPSTSFIPENASRNNRSLFIQGSNSLHSRKEEVGDDVIGLCSYLGPCPPDKDHTYTIKLYALDTVLDLEEGYFLNDFHWAIKNHVLDTAILDFRSRA